MNESHQYILSKFRNRLFDTSRLLHYKPNARFVNLTVGSVPLHEDNIQPGPLFTWNAEIMKSMKEIILNRYLRFEEHAYLAPAIDKVRLESQRDTQEYGFSQLRLAIAFLHWHNLRENQTGRIQSPLLMIPAEVRRTKGVSEDRFTIRTPDFREEKNASFWEVAVRVNKMMVRYGRLGSRGQILLKTFDSHAKANSEKEKLIREKLLKGYTKQQAHNL